MKSKEILDKNAKEILEKILSGESLSKIKKEYGVDQTTISAYYRKLFENDKKALTIFNTVLKITKEKTSSVNIENQKLEKYIFEYLSGKKTLKQVEKELGIHYQTFKKLMLKYISDNEILTQMYNNKQNQRADYSNVDFKKIIIEMLQSKSTQREMEDKYELTPKTLSKKIANLHDTEDEMLYRACKILSESRMNKNILNSNEIDFIDEVVEKYQEKEDKKEER